MLVSESWLREWVSPKISTEDLAEKLTLAGLEVESVTPAGQSLDNKKVVIGKIISVKPLPNATKLNLCEVDVGKSRNLPIVCGAANARVGIKTAVALSRAKLPNIIVSDRKIRGIYSKGILCSATELGLEESSDGILEFDNNAVLGMGVSDYLNLQDSVIELELTPNRGDCLGIAGVAREVSTLTNSKLKIPEVQKIKASIKKSLKVTLKAPKACPRYVGRAIIHIDMTAKTPDWMREKLRRSGMRSINPIVDVTNYVMHEIGQPMHAFDLKKIDGRVVVRMARKGEELKLLDGNTVKLSNDNLVIADSKKPIALAGIMGGDNSAISEETISIYLEAAYFSSAEIRGKARELSMQTDASHRFERGVDSELQIKAMERATQLILNIAGGQAGPITHAVDKLSLPKASSINFRNSEIARVLGMTIPVERSTQILKNLGMSVRTTKNGWIIKPPSWRFDIKAQHDLVEEVGRCFGFNNVPSKMPVSESRSGMHLEKNLSLNTVKQSLVQRGYHEAITYSFVDETVQKKLLNKRGAIRLSNPIADNMAVMRQSLWPGLLGALQTNLNRQEDRIRLFEIGHVFVKARNNRKSKEIQHVAGLICGNTYSQQWGVKQNDVDFFDIKGDVESIFQLRGTDSPISFQRGTHAALQPGQCAQIVTRKKEIGYVGKLNPVHQKFYDVDKSVYLFEIDAEFLSCLTLPKFSDISKFPSVQRDIAILVDESISVQSALDLIRASSGSLLRNLVLFDVYRGKNMDKNKKSFAFSLTFQSESSNLTSSEVDDVMDNLVTELEEKLKAQLR